MRIRFPHQLLWGITLLLLQAAGAQGHVWRVERDGSGDFTTIRPAIEASAPGDTILLGPGRYDESAPFSLPGWTESTYVPITVDSLTLRGVDRESVIIGPTAPDFQGLGPKGIVTDLNVTMFRLENLSVENVRDGTYYVGQSDIKQCTIRSCDIGVNEFTVGARVDSCHFEGNNTAIASFTGSSGLRIDGCTFDGNNLGIGINRTLDVAIQLCTFRNAGASATAIQYSENCTGLIADCKISDVGDGVAIRSQSDVTLQGTRIDAIYLGLNVFDGSIARGSGNVFRGGDAAVAFRTTSAGYLSGNHILKSTGWAAWCKGFNLYLVNVDLRNNYWGTDNADSISAWIFDGNDPQDPFYETNLSNVLYEPFSPVPVEAKETSTGKLKSMFHRR